MKKDKKYFLERLSCGISKMKRDNTIEKLRGPKERTSTKTPTERSTRNRSMSQDQAIRYDEMIQEMSPPRKPQKSRSNKKHVERSEEIPQPSYDQSKSSSSSHQLKKATNSTSGVGLGYHEGKSSSQRFNFQEEEEVSMNEERATEGEQSQSLVAESQHSGHKEACNNTGSPNEQQKQDTNFSDWMGRSTTHEVLKISICSICKNRRPKIGGNRDFTYAELHAATEGFSDKNFLSEGGFGSVYKGKLNGLKIAVKQHKGASFQEEKAFKSEVHVLSKARHENLVMLLGSCSEGSHRLLVYEFVCNGSLDQHLSKHTRRPLSWEKRMKIAMGAAKGLQYLHENNIVHRDMRPNNILITHDHDSLLGDFGLARTQHEDTDHSSDTRVVGTLGYLAPEYAECGKVSTKTDVYSFGVVLLQLITGLKTTDKILGGKSLVGWARPLLKDRNYPELIDQRILDSHDVHQLFWMVRVAEKCLSKNPIKRLTMDKVVNALNHIRESNAASGIMRDFSPAQSDSIISSSRESTDSGDEDTSVSIETSTTSVTSSMSQRSGRLSQSPPVVSALRLPPSPPLRAPLSSRSSSSKLYDPSTSGSGTD